MSILSVAMLLCDCAIWSRDVSPVGLLPPDTMAWFVEGIGGGVVDAELLRFFIGLRLLQMWARTPARAMDRVGRKAHVWRRIKGAAPRVLLDTGR